MTLSVLGEVRPFPVVYEELARRLLAEGADVEVRGKRTKELLGARFALDPSFPIPDRPKFNEKFALVETLQVVVGRADMRQLRRLAPGFPALAPTYVTYGPRLAYQLGSIYQRLSQEPDTRQAIMTVYQNEDFYKGYPEVPCTLNFQFLVRDQKLHLIVNMRSNDAWFGTPNDVYMFTFLQRELAGALDLDLGSYVHQVGSLHVYEEHFERLGSVGHRDTPGRESLPRGEFPWPRVRFIAQNALDFEAGEVSVEELGSASIWWDWIGNWPYV